MRYEEMFNVLYILIGISVYYKHTSYY